MFNIYVYMYISIMKYEDTNSTALWTYLMADLQIKGIAGIFQPCLKCRCLQGRPQNLDEELKTAEVQLSSEAVLTAAELPFLLVCYAMT